MTIDGVTPAPEVDAAERESLRLRRAAREFESVMLATLLKEMRASMPGVDKKDPGAGSLDSMGTTALADALARGGGMGISETLIRALEPQVRAYALLHQDGGRTP
jgi:Rod binding domain-containing protein